MLEAGGNAFDTAVAAAFALGVCEPQASGLGGQTMMLIHCAKEGTTIAVDGSSRAPSRAVKDAFSKKSSRSLGHRASSVPSTPATLGYVLKRYGTLRLSQVLEPAIQLAEEGYPITALQRRLQQRELKALKKGGAGKFFLRDGKRPFQVGSIFRQPVLAGTFRCLAREGIEDFYLGSIAQLIHEDMLRNGGLIRNDDLAHIPYPIERVPLRSRFGNMMISTMPPPGAGRTLIEILNILRGFPAKDRNPDTPSGACLLAETLQQAQLDRRDRPFDANFYFQVQDRKMLSLDYARQVAEEIRSKMRGDGETTHLSVMDREGNVVSLTQSIERVFGAKVLAPNLGFLYNNYMYDFEYQNMSHPYYLRPNNPPWANVAPTIIFRSRKPWLAIGSPGSERSVSAIAQVLMRLGRQTPFDAVAAPRMHCSYDGKVSIEAAHMRDDIPLYLEQRGFKISVRESMSFYLGCIQMVLSDNGVFIGVADPRRDGAARGPRS